VNDAGGEATLPSSVSSVWTMRRPVFVLLVYGPLIVICVSSGSFGSWRRASAPADASRRAVIFAPALAATTYP